MGLHAHNATQAEHGAKAVSWWSYVASPDFGGAVLENWQSEFLQFALFIGATVWLVQKGSNESSELDEVGLESREKQQIGRYAPPDDPRWAKVDDIRTRIYENWQSEFLAVGTMAVFTIYLRQRGSPESKPVGAPHDETASTG